MSVTKPPTTCVAFTYAERDSFRISEDKNRVIKTPNDAPRCHPFDGSASPEITGTGNTGTGIFEASAIFGAMSSGSPSHIGAAESGITGSASSWITGASTGPTASHGTIVVVESSPSGTTGPSAEPRVDGSTLSVSPWGVPAIFELRLGAKFSNETDRQGEVLTLTTARGRSRENPETGSAEPTQNDQASLATYPAFMNTRKPTSGFFLNRESINIETKTQRLDS